MKNFNGRPFFSLFFIARANKKKATWRSAARVFFYVFLDRWHFGGKWNPDGILEYSFKTDGILEVCR
jgi:hypothetical protein